MLIGFDPPFIFVHIPKTGGQSLSSSLLEHAPSSGDIRHDVFNPFTGAELERNPEDQSPLGHAHFSASYLRDKIAGREFWDRAFTFAIVRNPWDRLVSFFTWLGHSNTREARQHFTDNYTFKDYLRWLRGWDDPWLNEHYGYARQPGCTSQLSYVADSEGTVLVDHVGRFESLQDEHLLVCERLGVKPSPLRHRHRTRTAEQQAHYQERYDRESLRLARPLVENDSKHFGYHFRRS